MKDESNAVSDFYDDFSQKQIKTGVNIRHYYLAKKLKKYGIKKAENVLEIGCGIGTFTSLIAKAAKNAKITGADISEKNIQYAEKWHKDPRFKFIVSDFAGKVNIDQKFDFIVLADVIEHIPIEKYNVLFSNISALSHSNTIVFINIPHPEAIKYIRRTNPEALQVVDQSVTQDLLLPHLLENNFSLIFMEEYSLIHYEHDYVLYLLRKGNKKIENFSNFPKLKIILKKFRNRF